MTAQRIQLRRTKGWRKPDGAISVARPLTVMRRRRRTGGLCNWSFDRW